jgi:hypothetical protein
MGEGVLEKEGNIVLLLGDEKAKPRYQPDLNLDRY